MSFVFQHLPLPIDILIALVQAVDIVLRDRDQLAQLPRRPDNGCVVFGHHRCFDGVAGALADGEHAVILQQRGGTSMPAQCPDHQFADRLAADQPEAGAGDFAAEFVCHGGGDAGDGLPDHSKGGGITRMGMGNTIDRGQLAIDRAVRSGIGRRRVIALDDPPLQVDHDHVGGLEVVKEQSAGFDDDQVAGWVARGDVAARPGDQVVARQLGMELADFAAELFEEHGGRS